jgi:hypothetical protein
MNLPVTTPLRVTTANREHSSLSPARDKDSIQQLYKTVGQYAYQINALTDLVKTMGHEISKLKQTPQVGFGFFPFQIYNIPAIFTSSHSWNCYKVRQGSVLTSLIEPGGYISGSITGSLTQSMVIGCDNVVYSDSDFLPNPINTGDIMIPTGSAQYWIWVETSQSNYYLRHSDIPTSASTPNNPNPWVNFPSSSTGHYILGYVDTYSSQSENRAYVRQMQRTDIVNTPLSYVTMSACINKVPTIYYLAGYLSGSSPP